jgi:hypothetical protein
LGGDSGGRRSLRQPLHKYAVLGVVQVGHGVGHAPEWVALCVVVKLPARGAFLLAVEFQLETLRQHANPRLRVQLLESQELVENRVLQVVLGAAGNVTDDGVEALLPPLRGGLGIDEQASGLDGRDAAAIIDLHRAGAACNALAGGEFQLAGCIVAAMADDAAAFKYRQDGVSR